VIVAILVRKSHQLSAAAADAPRPAVFSRLGVLDVLQVRAPRPSGRKPHCARHLGALATKPGEICGLGWRHPGDRITGPGWFALLDVGGSLRENGAIQCGYLSSSGDSRG